MILYVCGVFYLCNCSLCINRATMSHLGSHVDCSVEFIYSNRFCIYTYIYIHHSSHLHMSYLSPPDANHSHFSLQNNTEAWTHRLGLHYCQLLEIFACEESTYQFGNLQQKRQEDAQEFADQLSFLYLDFADQPSSPVNLGELLTLYQVLLADPDVSGLEVCDKDDGLDVNCRFGSIW